MADQIQNEELIDAEPTKTFFVDMLTRDIPLEQAILDLVDNSVDGAKAMALPANRPFDQRKVVLEFDANRFRIWDNCGGFSRAAAKSYAFKFGRPPASQAPRTDHSIGQFGVGMKRALFKFGEEFVVRSATTEETWAVKVEVPKWEGEPGWHFPWEKFDGNDHVGTDKPGTEIIVTHLRPEVAKRFTTTVFKNSIIELIKSKHRQFIAGGLSVAVNGTHVDAVDLTLLKSEGFEPGTMILTFDEEGEERVDVRVIAAVGVSNPRQAGWYVVCNGRVVLEADRSQVTGWGLVEDAANRPIVPSFHNQFARFRGLVFFDSADSARVPWNTTKTSVDQDSPIWQATFQVMMEMMRPVIDFLNELDADIDEHSRNESPLLKFVNKSQPAKPDSFTQASNFRAPKRTSFSTGPKTVKIQYSRRVDDVEFLEEELGLSSARAVGERTFDLILKRQRGQ